MKKKPLSTQEYRWLASGVCLEECNGERNIGLPPFADPLKATDADMPAAAKFGDKLIPLLIKKREGLRKLGFPDAGEDTLVIKEAIRHFEATIDAFIKANDAAHQGVSAKFRKYWLEGRQHDQVADTLFEAFDLPLCAAD